MLFHARKHDVFCDGQQAAGAARQPDKKVGTDYYFYQSLIEILDFLGAWIDSNSDQKLNILRFKLNKLLLQWRAAHTGWIFLNSQSAILKLLVLDELVLSPLHCLSCSSGYRAKRYYLVLQECYCGSWLFFKRGKKKMIFALTCPYRKKEVLNCM